MRRLPAMFCYVLLAAAVQVEAHAGDAQTRAVTVAQSAYSQYKQPDKDLKLTEAFSEWAGFLVGGVWTATDARGEKHEQRWAWVLNRSFLQATWTATGDSGLSLFGIDPATRKLTWWGFDDKGRIWKGTTALEVGEWADEGTGQGVAGSNSWKARLTRLGPDRARLEIQENVVDGKTFAPEVLVLTRKK